VFSHLDSGYAWESIPTIEVTCPSQGITLGEMAKVCSNTGNINLDYLDIWGLISFYYSQVNIFHKFYGKILLKNM
jgi:hypothetical protein